MSLDVLNGVDEVDLLNDELDLHYQRSVDDERMIEMSGYRSESGGSDGWRSEGDPKGTKEGKVSSTRPLDFNSNGRAWKTDALSLMNFGRS